MADVLVDTSVWIRFLSHSQPQLSDLLGKHCVVQHEFVGGEIALGNLKNRSKVMLFYNSLPRVATSSHDHVEHFLNYHKLFGKGVGWIDLHLLCSAIENDLFLWTEDKRLGKLADKFSVAFN